MTNYANPFATGDNEPRRIETHAAGPVMPAQQPTQPAARPDPNLAIYDRGVTDLFFPVDIQPLYYQTDAIADDMIQADPARFRAVVKNPDTGRAELLGVVGGDYTLIPHAEMRDAMIEGMTNALGRDAMASARFKNSLSRGGAFVKQEIVFPQIKVTLDEGSDLKVGWNHERDHVNAYRGADRTHSTDIFYRGYWSNSYDGSSPAKMGGGGLDIACLNGMISQRAQHILQRKHSGRLKLPDFTSAVEASVEAFYDSGKIIQQWANRQIGAEQARELLAGLPKMSERKAKKIAERFELEAKERGQSFWALYSAMTFYASHNDSGFEVRKTGQDNIAEALDKREEEVLLWVQTPAWREAVRV